MTEWSELTWTCIGLIAASVVLSLMFMFTGIGKNMTAIVYQDQADAQAMQEIRTFLPYDNTTVSGAEAMSAMLEMADNNVPTILCVSNTSTVIMYKSSTTADKIKAQLSSTLTTSNNAMWTRVKTAISSGTYKNNRDYTPSTLVSFLDGKLADFQSKNFKATLVTTDGGFVEAVLFRYINVSGTALYD